jgi:nitrate/nitrite transport system permease protein
MFTGFRLSLGINGRDQWAEILTGVQRRRFLWQNARAEYSTSFLSSSAIGIVGFVLDRLMSMMERRF